MSRIALVTTDPGEIGFDDPDLIPLLEAIAAAGHEVTTASWRDDSAPWERFDLAVIRSPWDYMHHERRFLEWLEAVAQRTSLWNPPELIAWNLNKRYLLELDVHGVPVVPTLLATSPSEVGEAIEAIRDSGFDDVVVKPTVSAGSIDTGLFAANDPAAMELARHILKIGKTVMVQPAIPSVAEVGERALVFFDGELSHAFSKGPLLTHGGGLRSGTYTEVLEFVTATVDEIDVASHAMEVIARSAPGLDGAAPLYGRLDLVATDDGPLLLEAELFEPSYNVWLAEGSAQRFVAALERRLDH